MTEFTTEEISINDWVAALERAARCVPNEIKEKVLTELLRRQQVENEKMRTWTWESVKPWEPGPIFSEPSKEMAAMVQVLVRNITNNNSPDRAAWLLFRDQKHGTGSRWLPDYLDGLPGISVDREECITISENPVPQGEG